MTHTTPNGDVITIHVNVRKLYAALVTIALLTGGNLTGTALSLLNQVDQSEQLGAAQVDVERAADAAEYAEANAETFIDLQLQDLHDRCLAVGYTPKTAGDPPVRGTTDAATD